MATNKQKKYGDKVRKQIDNATDSLQMLSEINLASISERLIEDIFKNKKKISDKKAYLATDEVKSIGVKEYKRQMKELLTMIVTDTWSIGESYTGIKAPIKFKSEFEKLNKSVRDRIRKTSDLLIGSQIADLEKNIFFKYDDAIFRDLSDKETLLNLEEAAEKFYTGSSISAGSAKVGAEFVNYSLSAYYATDEVAKELEAFLFYNPQAEVAICVSLQGQYFPVNDPNLERYTPPLHWNCRSTLVPILNGQLPKDAKIEKLNPSNTAKKSIQFSNTQNMNKFLEGRLYEQV